MGLCDACCENNVLVFEERVLKCFQMFEVFKCFLSDVLLCFCVFVDIMWRTAERHNPCQRMNHLLLTLSNRCYVTLDDKCYAHNAVLWLMYLAKICLWQRCSCGCDDMECGQVCNV